jgi:RNA polymerase sigma factor (sigma-70 family)
MRRKQQEGSREAGDALVLRYLPRMERWVVAWGGCRHLQAADVSELYQELAVVLPEILNRFDAAEADGGQPRPVTRYCYWALRHRFCDHLRRRFRAEQHYDRSCTAAERLEALARRTSATFDWMAPPLAARDNPVLAAVKAEAVAAARQALDELDPTDRFLVESYVAKVPLTRVAALLDLSYHAAWRRRLRLLTDLAARLAPWR